MTRQRGLTGIIHTHPTGPMMERSGIHGALPRVAANALALAIVTFAAAACGERAGGGSGQILIGLAGPLELTYGQSMQRAAEMAAEEINAAGGAGGRQIQLVIRDDAADGERAIVIANEFVANPDIVAVIGHITSGATLAAAGIYNAAENPLLELSPTASSPLISDAGEWTFRVCPSDLEHGPALAAWATQLGARSANVMYANDAYGRGVLESFIAAYRRGGGRIVGSDPFLPTFVEQAGFLDPYIERAVSHRAEALVIGGLATEAIEVITSARRLGFRGPILGADGLLGVEEAGAVAEGVYVSTPFLPDMPAPATQQFVAAYRERFGVAPDAYAALTYDALKLLARAIGEAGPDRRELRDRVAGVGREHAAFEGVTGRIAFDENGDVADKPVVIGVVRDGTIVTANGVARAATPVAN
jgi:branched-chain amino acid transport system substrate-binding protein